MQDFYILQRTPTALNSEQAKKWFYTIEMLGPEGIMAGDDDTTTNLMLGMQDEQYVYILPLVRHLTGDEAERIVEGYMRVTEHDFEIETSNVYRADADFGHPFEYDINIEEDARLTLYNSMARQHHNRWIQERQQNGWRFGLNLDLTEKTHPAMRPWDDLPESYQQRMAVKDKELVDFYAKNKSQFT
jgi:hypothetical protein